MPSLRAGYDFLGKLGNDLRDLIGLDTLFNELVQNADDAPGATQLAFTSKPDELVVWNDGRFTDCGDQTAVECPGVLDEARKTVRCDFHSLRLIACQGKREKTDTTG